MTAKRKPTEPRPERGRPTKYETRFCDEVEAFMAQGFSLSAFAGHIGVARSTINEWIDANPDFSEAVSRAKGARLLHWERAAMKVAEKGGGPGTATVIVFGLKNMGGDEWADVQRREVTGPNGKPIQTDSTFRLEFVDGGQPADDPDSESVQVPV